MLRHLRRRLAWGVVTLLVFVTITFFAVHLVFPFDYVSQFAIGWTPEEIQARRADLGLDRPLVVQYLVFLGGLARGSLGTSFGGASVGSLLIEQALPSTLLIFVVGGVFAYLFGAWLGRVVAWRRHRLVAGSATSAGVLLYTAFPPWLVFLLLYFFTEPLFRLRSAVGLPIDSRQIWALSAWEAPSVLVRMSISLLLALIASMLIRLALRRLGVWRWSTLLSLPLPFAGAVASWHRLGFGTEATDMLFRASPTVGVGRGSAILVFLAFVLLAFGEIMFVIRTSMAAERPEQYVVTARAKGLAEHVVRDRHVARNAVLPAISRFFASAPYILTGLIIIEREFAIQGLSTTLFTAIEQVDVPLIIGTLVAIGMMVLVLRLVLEVAHAWLDPRIRFAETR